MTTLYICVDESGRHHDGRCYSVAGCWFLSDRRPTDALDRTKDKLIGTMFGDSSGVSELKGSKVEPSRLNDGVSYLRSIVYEDDSIQQEALPWSLSIPLGISVVAFTPDDAISTISKYVDKLDRPRVVQAFALNAILKPLIHPKQVRLDPTVDDVRIVLDSKTWEQPAEDYPQTEIQDKDLELETRDSQSVPGIQLADLAAYSWRRNYTHGDCGTAAGVLHDLRFAR